MADYTKKTKNGTLTFHQGCIRQLMTGIGQAMGRACEEGEKRVRKVVSEMTARNDAAGRIVEGTHTPYPCPAEWCDTVYPEACGNTEMGKANTSKHQSY